MRVKEYMNIDKKSRKEIESIINDILRHKDATSGAIYDVEPIGANTLHLSFVALQRPVRVGIHASDILPLQKRSRDQWQS
jgi:hypothetical protein